MVSIYLGGELRTCGEVIRSGFRIGQINGFREVQGLQQVTPEASHITYFKREAGR